jgi:hypothetical protein
MAPNPKPPCEHGIPMMSFCPECFTSGVQKLVAGVGPPSYREPLRPFDAVKAALLDLPQEDRQKIYEWLYEIGHRMFEP